MRLHTALLGILLLGISGCELDGFLFNEEAITRYELPGNTIPDSLLEAVTFTSGGNTLHGYWVRAEGAAREMTILYCHGNKHNMDEYWDRVMLLHGLGVNVFIFDYRGFGLSEGESSENGLREDGEAALIFVQATYGVSADSLCLYGYSLGNVVSIHLAANAVTPLCLIAEAPFASANSLTQSGTGLDLPARWMTEGAFDNAGTIGRIRTPLLVIHGENDDFVRFWDNGKIVFENAPEPKQLLLVPRAVHTDIPAVMGTEAYQTAVRDWIEYSISR